MRRAALQTIATRYEPEALRSAAFGAAVVLFVVAPLLFTEDGFSPDVTNAMWLGYAQGQGLLHWPTYFISTTSTSAPPFSYASTGLFNPIFAFYGGPAFYALAVFSWLFRSVDAGYCLLTVAAVGAAYGGTYWLARQIGVFRAAAHVPPIIYVASAYYVTDMYGRGDWTELIAVSALPLLFASAWALRSDQRRTFSSFLLFAATAALTGSSDLVMFWGLVVTSCSALVFVLTGRLQWKGHRKWGPVAPPILLALGVNAWFLLPDLVNATRTAAYRTPVIGALVFDTFSNVFNPLRSVPPSSTTPALYTQLPDVYLLWGGCAVIAVWAARAHNRGLARRGVVALTVTIALTISAIVWSRLWLHIPAVFMSIQWPYRLTSFADLAVAIWVAFLLVALRSSDTDFDRGAPRRRRLSGSAFERTAMVLVLPTLALAAWQLWIPNAHAQGADSQIADSYANRSIALDSPHVAPRSWYAPLNFIDASEPVIVVPPGRSVTFGDDGLNSAGDRYARRVMLPSGPLPIATNVVAGPYLVSITGGVREVGRDANGFAVIERTTDRPSVLVRIDTATTATIVTARWMTLISLTVLVGLCVRRLMLGDSRRRAHRRSESLRRLWRSMSGCLFADHEA